MSTTTASQQPGLENSFLDKLGDGFNSFVEGSINLVTRLLGGSANDRAVKNIGYIRYKNAETHTVIPGSILDQVNKIEPTMKELSDEELKGLTAKFRDRLAQGEDLEDILPEAFAACREVGWRTKGMRHYDVQIVGGAILHQGNIAEMVTGEGKTLVATLAAYLNAIEGKGVHVVTVNDYLARRDCEWMLPIYNGLGVTASYIQSDMDPQTRRAAYECDITYGTNSEFGFDYLRDNMKPARHDDEGFHPYYRQAQRTPLNFAIIDEVDNILIDEARTPLIISGPAHADLKKYEKADDIARKLTDLERKARQEVPNEGLMKLQGTEGNNLPILVPVDPTKIDPQNPPPKGVYFEVKEKERTCHLTDAGVREAERLAGVESFYTAGNMEWPHNIDNALKAHHLYEIDRQYMIARDPREENQLAIIIIDEFTGRAMFGRQWSDGLHQAVEAKHKKDGVVVKQETQTLATITLQNFFKLYKKLGGMTGTAMTEANEFWKIYKLDVIAVPTNKHLQRVNSPDLVYRSDRERWDAVVQEIIEVSKSGRPVLIGTTDVAKSEKLSGMLKRKGIKHELLNAKPENVAREAEIVAQAGRLGAVTISTNMAGRGTDIILGGNPETMAWARLSKVTDADGRPLYPTRLEVPDDVWSRTVHEIESKEKMKEEGRKVAEMGGLHIVGTERHESRRIDNQLRGRAGRQGDPGSSRFYVSLEDPLMRMFGGERMQRIMNSSWVGLKEGEALESNLLSRQIQKAQKKVEDMHFEQRKNLLEYDEVMDYQRKRTYGTRQGILDGENPRAMLLGMIDVQLKDAVKRYTDEKYNASAFAQYASGEFGIEFDPADFKGVTYEEAVEQAQTRAIESVQVFVQESLDENLNIAEDERDWKWQELSRAINARYRLKTTDRELKKIGRDNIDSYIIEEAEKAILEVDLTGGKRFLDPKFGIESLVDWCRQKFNVTINLDDAEDRDADELFSILKDKILAAYRMKDIEFPLQVGMSAYLPEKAEKSDRRPDREGLHRWAHQRFGPAANNISEELVRTETRSTIRNAMRESSQSFLPKSDYPEIDAKLNETFRGTTTSDADDAKELTEWFKNELRIEISPEVFTGVTKQQARDIILNIYDHAFRPEMHRTERELVLEQLDGAWKSHLLTMDHLRSTVGLAGYAQEDPKIVYKREGMKLFDEMWAGVRDRVTESIFRMEDVAAEQVEMAIWAGAQAHQQQAESLAQSQLIRAALEQQEMSTNSGGDGKKTEPIRNTGAKVGRNDPCPCGSGKKFKNCHMNLQNR